MSCPLYVAGRFPVSEMFEMPSDIDDGWVTGKVYTDLLINIILRNTKMCTSCICMARAEM